MQELTAVAFFVVTGWVALWPLRDRLGAYGYHLAALPTGLLAGSLAGTFSTLTRRPFDEWSALAGAVLLVLVVWGIAAAANDPAARGARAAGPVGARSFIAAAGAIGGIGALLGFVRLTVANNDSFMSYWPLGVELSRRGVFTETLLRARGPLLPGMNAVHVLTGSDWAYVIYGLMAATVAGWLAWTLAAGPLATTPRRNKLLVVGVAVGLLALEPSYLFHSFFVHSHMVSAMYLLMALTSLWAALRHGVDPDAGIPSHAFLILAGVFTAGFALARPDGLAYQFVPVAVALSVLTVFPVRGKSVLAYFGPLLVLVIAPYAAGISRLGVWESSKLGGAMTIAILGVLVLSAAGPWIFHWLDRRLPFRAAGEPLLALLTATAAVLMVAAVVFTWGSSAQAALANAAVNLFAGAGGYFHLWWAVALLLIISVVTGDALRTGSWTRGPFLSIMLFLVIAIVVHATSHEGRLGVGDSLNRVVFHVFPLAVWYFAAVAARILTPAEQNAES